MVKSTDFYMVFGLKHLTGMDEQKIEDYFVRMLEFSKKYNPGTQLIILEFGKKNDNPHLNVCWECIDNPIHDTQLRREILNFYTPDELKKSNLKNLVSCGILKDKIKLIGGYLHKENNSKVLLDDGFDVDWIKEEWDKREDEHVKPKREKKKTNIVSKYNGATVMKKYIIDNNIEYNCSCQNFRDIVIKMATDGWVFSDINDIKHIKLCLDPLFGHTKNLKGKIEIVLNMYAGMTEEDFAEWDKREDERIADELSDALVLS